MAEKNKQPPEYRLTHLSGPPIDILLAERLWKVGGSWGFRLCVCDLGSVPSFWDKHGSWSQTETCHFFLCAWVLSCFSYVRLFQPTRLLCPWDSPGKNTGVGCYALLQGILLTQGSNPVSCVSCIAGGFFTAAPLGKPLFSLCIIANLYIVK